MHRRRHRRRHRRVYALTHRDDFDRDDFTGALGLSGGRALATAAVTDAAISMGYTYAINTVRCQPTSPTDVLIGGLGGALRLAP